MKILVLNQHVSSDDPTVQKLESLNLGVLLSSKADEAFQLIEFHGNTIDIALVHRELEGKKNSEGGLKFINKLRGLPAAVEVPIILSSETWKDAEYYEHQNSPQGVNAYFSWPWSPDLILEAISAILGASLRPKAVPPPPPQVTGSFENPTLRIPAPPQDSPSAAPFSQMSPEPPNFSSVGPVPSQQSTAVMLEDSPNLENAVPFESSSEISLVAPNLGNEENPAVNSAVLPQNPPFQDPEVTGVVPLDQMSISELFKPMEKPSEPISPTLVHKAPLPNVEVPSIALPTVASANPEISPNASGDLTVEISNIFAKPDAKSSSLSDSDDATVFNPEFGAETVAVQFPQKLLKSNPLTLDPDQVLISSPDSNLDPRADGPSNFAADIDDNILVQNLPYLFNKNSPGEPLIPNRRALVSESFSVPVGDAIIPGGTVTTPDIETLKKYLSLREQDVAVLSVQLRTSQNQVQSLQEDLQKEINTSGYVSEMVKELKQKINDYITKESLQEEIKQRESHEIQFQLRSRDDKIPYLEVQLQQAEQETDRLKERVRIDIRKIKVREKELENRLEIVSKDSEALLSAREEKIVELKRKLDLLEFNMDLIQNKLSKEKDTSTQLKEKMAKATQAIRVANGLLEAKEK